MVLVFSAATAASADCPTGLYREALWELHNSTTEFGADSYVSTYRGTPGFDEKAQNFFLIHTQGLSGGKWLALTNSNDGELVFNSKNNFAYRLKSGGSEVVSLPSSDFPFSSFREFQDFRYNHLVKLWRIKVQEAMKQRRTATGEAATTLTARIDKMNRTINTIRVCTDSGNKAENNNLLREIRNADSEAGIK